VRQAIRNRTNEPESLAKDISMYLKHWGLGFSPFENVPNRNLFFRSSQHEEALSRMFYAVENRKGAAMLTGDVGSGKTTVSRRLMNHLEGENYEVHTIVNPVLSPIELIEAIVLKIGGSVENDSKVVLWNKLQSRLAQNADQGLNTVLIVDEAHLIKDRACLEELRMLLNMQSEQSFLITLILLGQPPLRQHISELRPLDERISIRYHLEPLNLQDTVRYILYRIKSAGAKRGIFTKEAIFPLYEYARGLPLRINNICDRSLLIGLMKRVKRIDTNIVNEAIDDLV
jgi:general secretion pathway protein A